MSTITTTTARFAILSLLLLTLPGMVEAQYNYTTISGTVTITGYYGPGGTLDIPNTIVGLPVTSIGESAFTGYVSLTSIIIPSSVTSIGNYGFYGCSKLPSVAIPDNVTNIKNHAFQACTSVANLTIGNSVTTIGTGAFDNCTTLTSVTIPSTVSSIGDFVFSQCGGLHSVTIGNSVTSIGRYAFCNDGSLASVTIPSSVTNIGEYAFASTSLTAIYFLGNAPSSDGSVFINVHPTVYYLPGTSGWGVTFYGCPTHVWMPLPSITSQPQSQTVNRGNTATFTVAANGTVSTNATVPLSYQWLFNGGTIGGATTNTYIITNVQPLDAGSYSVVVSDAAGSVTSAVAVLTVLFPHAARATATVVNGFMVEATITDQGWGYTNTPSVRIIGGGGSGAQSVAVVSNGMVTAVNILNPGAGYTNTLLVVIDPPLISNPVLAIAPMSFLSFSNLALGGTYQLQRSIGWYWSNQPVGFTATNTLYTQMVAGVAGSGDYRLALNPVPAQAFATAIVDYGFVVHAAVTSGGSGYVTSPAVTIIGGGGTNATAVAQISGGVVTNVIITDAGISYTNAPTIKIAQPPAAAVSPTTVLPVMRIDSANLAPYDNYQIQFKSDLGGTWEDWNGGLFSPTDVTNSQHLFITNGVGFFRLQYLR
jgi:hypothetical protein